jgi:hypothetical protein
MTIAERVKFDADIRAGKKSVVELHGLVHHPSPVTQANAIWALAAQEPDINKLVDTLIAVASDPKNSAFRFWGRTVVDIAVVELVRTQNPRAIDAARTLAQTWTASDRSSLAWQLRDEGLPEILSGQEKES